MRSRNCRLVSKLTTLSAAFVLGALTPHGAWSGGTPDALKGDRLVQAECTHTYREPGCVGGEECIRREQVECPPREPSTLESIRDGLRGIGEGGSGETDESRDSDDRKGPTAFGVRG